MTLRDRIIEHFDGVSADYDRYKSKNWYYHSELKRLYKELIRDAGEASILEVGCATGDILKCLSPALGVGIDISAPMLQKARQKYDQFHYVQAEGENLPFASDCGFEWIILPDTLEHLYDPASSLRELSRIVSSNTNVIISWANPLWSPILHILEALRLKMPEGPHKWIGLRKLRSLAQNNGLAVSSRGYRALLPMHIPLVSRFINRLFYRVPLIRNLGLIQYVVLVKKCIPQDGNEAI